MRRDAGTEGCWHLEVRLWDNFEKLAHVYTRWGVTARSNWNTRSEVLLFLTCPSATLGASYSFLQEIISIHQPGVVTGLLFGMKGDSSCRTWPPSACGRQLTSPRWRGTAVAAGAHPCASMVPRSKSGGPCFYLLIQNRQRDRVCGRLGREACQAVAQLQSFGSKWRLFGEE